MFILTTATMYWVNINLWICEINDRNVTVDGGDELGINFIRFLYYL